MNTSGPASSLRVLYVEDHADTAQIFRLVLEERGYTVELAVNCQNAMGLACSAHFDLLLCDVILPDGDGCDLLRALREELGQGNLLAIALSAHGTPEAIERARAAGFDAHILKPIDMPQVFNAIEEIWRNASARGSSDREFILVGHRTA